jgi:hypothetical protein
MGWEKIADCKRMGMGGSGRLEKQGVPLGK